MRGQVFGLYICYTKGRPMEQVSAIQATCGFGIHGDHHAGTAPDMWAKTREVTLIAVEAVRDANEKLEGDDRFSFADTRRNIVTVGIDLNALVGKEFTVGTIRLRGVDLCHPCRRPSKLSGKFGFKQHFEGRGGLRAEVITSGTTQIGDDIVIDEQE